jgi:hypothetical protein
VYSIGALNIPVIPAFPVVLTFWSFLSFCLSGRFICPVVSNVRSFYMSGRSGFSMGVLVTANKRRSELNNSPHISYFKSDLFLTLLLQAEIRFLNGSWMFKMHGK